MANEVKLTIRVSDNGSLDVVAKSAKKAAKSTEDLGKATDKTKESRKRYSRGEKGVANATANSTKAFSKMRDSMTGGGGLVPAYATLAANVFALSAAFNVLRRAAQVEQLNQGLAEMGRASGLAMGTLARGMQEATKHALTLEEAMRATSMITSAGLDASLVDDFGAAAQKAAVALGRNTQDSLERFTRGVTKLEPELLDELGLFVRVDEAAEDYARSIGKTASQLTSFEKRQAFANAALEQANEKFGSVEVDANPYDRLAAAFADLSKTGLNLLNTVLEPLISFLASSTTALTGAMALFASTISGSIVGGLASYAEKARAVSQENKGLTAASRAQLNIFNRSSATLKNLSQSLIDGSAATYEYNKAVGGQQMSMMSNLGLKKRGIITEEEYARRVKVSTQAINEIRGAEMRQRLSGAALAESKAMAALQAGRYGVVLKNLKRTMLLYRGSLAGAMKAQGLFTKSLRVGTVALKAFGTAARIAGAAFSVLLGPISLAILAFSLLKEGYEAIRPMFVDEATLKLEEHMEGVADTVKEVTNNLNEANLGFEGNSSKIRTLTDSYIAYGNVLSQVIETTKDIDNIGAKGGLEEQRKIIQDLINEGGKLRDAFKETFGTTLITSIQTANGGLEEQIAKTREFLEAQRALGLRVQAVKEAFRSAGEAVANYINKLKPQTAVTQVAETLTALNTAIKTADVADIPQIIKEGLESDKALADLVTNMILPEDSISERAKALQERMTAAQEGLKIAGANYAKATTQAQKDGIQISIDYLVKEYTSAYKELEDLTKDGGPTLTTQDQINLATEMFTKENNRLVVAQEGITTAKEALALEKARGDISEEGRSRIIALENKHKSLILDNLKGQEDFNRRLAKTLPDSELKNQLLAEAERLLQQQKRITEEMTDTQEREVALAKQGLTVLQEQQKASKALLDLDARRARNQQMLMDAQRTTLEKQARDKNAIDFRRGFDPALNAQDQLQIEKQLQAAKEAAAKNQYDLAVKRTEMEFKLLEAQMRVLAEEARLNAIKTKETDPTASAAFSTLAGELDVAKGTLDTLRQETLNALEKDYEATLDKIAMKFQDTLSTAQASALSATGQGDTTQRALAMSEMFKAGSGSGEGSMMEELPLTRQLGAMQNVLTPLMEDLRKLGPEGELAAAMSQGAMTIAMNYSMLNDVFTATGDNAATQGEKIAASAQAISAGIGAVNQIMQSQANAQIKKIDDQIKAEQKRDGKSKESLSKIQALEKKKEAIERKAFERNKKMQMAQTIANTAAGIAGVLSGIKDPIVTAPLAFATAVMIGAMGAAQLAVIAGTSFQGGGSSPSVSTPTAITAGQRQSSVDLAKSQSARGELAYFRGEQGMGGPESFRPTGAFAGYKNRAAGGNTAFMVGEQGPELFVPETPGTIVPNGETQMGAPTNVTFSINTIDASGVEDLLVAQRGNIIGMIRQAANSYGQDFVEEVDTSVFTQSSGGVNRY